MFQLLLIVYVAWLIVFRTSFSSIDMDCCWSISLLVLQHRLLIHKLASNVHQRLRRQRYLKQILIRLHLNLNRAEIFKFKFGFLWLPYSIDKITSFTIRHESFLDAVLHEPHMTVILLLSTWSMDLPHLPQINPAFCNLIELMLTFSVVSSLNTIFSRLFICFSVSFGTLMIIQDNLIS